MSFFIFSTLKVYEIVGLQCINPSFSGGEFRISNAVNAWEKLKLHLPEFLRYELLRAIPRDVLESGKGRGVDEGIISKLSRADNLLALRVRRNSYPIFVEDEDKMQFRYMRYWIESGHQKAGVQISPLLSIAMDFLDQELDKGCIFEQNMQRGDMGFTNNVLVAHARNSFKSDPTGETPPRHKVRAWIQVQNKQSY